MEYRINLIVVISFVVGFSSIIDDVNSTLNVDKYVNQITIDLVKHKSGKHRLMEMGVHPGIIEKLFPKKPPRPTPGIENDTIQLFKNMDSEFYGEVLLGHPGQKFKISFDTSWSDSFVPSSLCPFYDAVCRDHSRYDHRQSSQYQPNGTVFEVDFGSSGKLTGFLSEDLMHIGHINITNQTFAEITQFPSLFASNSADGIFGMGFPDTGRSVGNPFFFNIMAQYPNMPRLFSFYLNRNPGSTKKGGSLSLGFANSNHYRGNITYFPVLQPPIKWRIKMDKVYFKNPMETFCSGGCEVSFDTGATNIDVPKVDYEKLNLRIGAFKMNDSNRYVINCDDVYRLPRVYFVFSGTVFFLKGKDYIQNINYGPVHKCITAFEESSNDIWALGGTFLYQHYSVYDVENGRVGLAPAII